MYSARAAAAPSADAQMLRRLAETHSRVCVTIATLLETTPQNEPQKRRDLLEQWQAAYDDFSCVRSWLVAVGEPAPPSPPVPNCSKAVAAAEPGDAAEQGKRTCEHTTRRLLESAPFHSLVLCGSFGLAAIRYRHLGMHFAFVLLLVVCVARGVAGARVASHLACILVVLYRACLLFYSVFVLSLDGLEDALANTVKHRDSVSTIWLCVGFVLGADPHTSSRVKYSTLLLYGALRVCGLVTTFARTGSPLTWSAVPLVSDLPLLVSFLSARTLVRRLSSAERSE